MIAQWIAVHVSGKTPHRRFALPAPAAAFATAWSVSRVAAARAHPACAAARSAPLRALVASARSFSASARVMSSATAPAAAFPAASTARAASSWLTPNCVM